MKPAAPRRKPQAGDPSTSRGEPAGADRDSASPTVRQGRAAPTRIRGSPGSGTRGKRPLRAPLAEASRL